MTAATAGDQPYDLVVSAQGANAVGSIVHPALSCSEGGKGPYRHSFIEAPLPGGVMSSLAGNLRASLDVHLGEQAQREGGTAYLLGSESHATLSNARGAVQVRLESGECFKPTMSFDGITVSGDGTWSILPTGGTGSYRSASGSGSFGLTVDVAPGADNPWALDLRGSLNILSPGLRITPLRAYWGHLGVDYALRVVTVEYRITNIGPGDSYGVVLEGWSSPTPGVAGLGPVPPPLGDLLEGESVTVEVQYRLDLLSPCTLVIIDCIFDTTLTVTMPDALDVPHTFTAGAQVTAPMLPPPLEEVP